MDRSERRIKLPSFAVFDSWVIHCFNYGGIAFIFFCLVYFVERFFSRLCVYPLNSDWRSPNTAHATFQTWERSLLFFFPFTLIFWGGNFHFPAPFWGMYPHLMLPSAVSLYPSPIQIPSPCSISALSFAASFFVRSRKRIDSDQSVSSRGSGRPTNVLISQFCMRIWPSTLANWQPISVSKTLSLASSFVSSIIRSS